MGNESSAPLRTRLNLFARNRSMWPCGIGFEGSICGWFLHEALLRAGPAESSARACFLSSIPESGKHRDRMQVLPKDLRKSGLERITRPAPLPFEGAGSGAVLPFSRGRSRRG